MSDDPTTLESALVLISDLRRRLDTEDQVSTEAIEQRDAREEQIDAIADALGDEGEWSNLHDRGKAALQLAHDCVAENENHRKAKAAVLEIFARYLTVGENSISEAEAMRAAADVMNYGAPEPTPAPDLAALEVDIAGIAALVASWQNGGTALHRAAESVQLGEARRIIAAIGDILTSRRVPRGDDSLGRLAIAQTQLANRDADLAIAVEENKRHCRDKDAIREVLAEFERFRRMLADDPVSNGVQSWFDKIGLIISSGPSSYIAEETGDDYEDHRLIYQRIKRLESHVDLLNMKMAKIERGNGG